MKKQTVKCRSCGTSYDVHSDCATDQSVCPPCRYKGRSPQDAPEPLDFSGLENKYKVTRRSK